MTEVGFSQLGEPATYRPQGGASVDTCVLFDESAEDLADGEVIEMRPLMTLPADIGTVRVRDVIELRGKQYVVEGVRFRDAYRVEAWVR